MRTDREACDRINAKHRGGIEWGFSYRIGRKEAVFRIFDKNGKTRSKLTLDEEQLVAMGGIIDRILNGENEEE